MKGETATMKTLTAEQATCRLATVQTAIKDLKLVRDGLRAVNCSAAADAVARALKSVEGAERHAERLYLEASAARLGVNS